MIVKKHYILLKTHNKTGLKYLCKHVSAYFYTCFSYLGSGIRWKRHLQKHGEDISTEILAVCDSLQEAKEQGMYFSNLFDVVNNKNFANLIPENGQGGAEPVKYRKTHSGWRGFSMPGDKNPSKRKDVRNKISHKLKGRNIKWGSKISQSCKGRIPHNKGKKEIVPRINTHIYRNNLVSCVKCQATGAYGAMKRWHLDNCKRKSIE